MAGAWTRVVGLLSAGSKITASGWVLGVKNAVDDLQGSWAGAFANAAARDAALTSPANGTTCYLLDVDKLVTRRAGAWVPVVVGDATWTNLAAATASLRSLDGTTGSAAPFTHTHGAGASLNTQSFTASGTFTTSASTTSVLVLLVGGGGSGNPAGGGGGGGAVKYLWVSVTPSTGYTVTIGGSSYLSAGGASSFGALLTCAGGNPGVSSGSGGRGGDSGNGNAGGSAFSLNQCGGGGAGAGGPGGAAAVASASNSSFVAWTLGGNGGPGILGFGGGGGGSSASTNSRGSCGGGDGTGGSNGTNAVANSGSGGGAQWSASSLGASGFCQVWWFA